MTNKNEHGGTTERESGESKHLALLMYGILRNLRSATGAPAQIVNTTLVTEPRLKQMEEVDALPLETLTNYWITKFGFDWVHDKDVHKNLFDSLVCMRLRDEKVVEETEIMVPALDAHKNGYPRYQSTYRIRRDTSADS